MSQHQFIKFTFLVGIFTLTPVTAIAAKNYALICNFANNEVTSEMNILGEVDISKKARWYTYIAFKGSNTAASVAPPKPGECAWFDRGWRSGEPQKLLLKPHSNESWKAFNGRISSKGKLNMYTRQFGGDSDASRMLNQLLNGQAKKFDLRVRNINNRVLFVEQIGVGSR